MGGVEFQIDSVNNKGQYSIDGGSTWQNFSSGSLCGIWLLSGATECYVVDGENAYKKTGSYRNAIVDWLNTLTLTFIDTFTRGGGTYEIGFSIKKAGYYIKGTNTSGPVNYNVGNTDSVNNNSFVLLGDTNPFS